MTKDTSRFQVVSHISADPTDLGQAFAIRIHGASLDFSGAFGFQTVCGVKLWIVRTNTTGLDTAITALAQPTVTLDATITKHFGAALAARLDQASAGFRMAGITAKAFHMTDA
jgi:hypothetical protein